MIPLRSHISGKIPRFRSDRGITARDCHFQDSSVRQSLQDCHFQDSSVRQSLQACHFQDSSVRQSLQNCHFQDSSVRQSLQDYHFQDSSVRQSLEEAHSNDQAPACDLNDCTTPRKMMIEYRNKLSDEEAHILRHILIKNRFLKKLTIWHASLRAIKIAFEDVRPASLLQELELVVIDCEGDDFCMSLVGVFRNLRFLRLGCHNMGGVAFATSIENFLRDNNSLKELHISFPGAGNDGAKALAVALRVNSTLKKIRLEERRLALEALIDFAEALLVNRTLEMLDVSSVDVQEQQLSCLAKKKAYSDVFKRMHVVWSQGLLSHLTGLLRQDKHCSMVSVNVTESVDEVVLRQFFDAVAANTTVRALRFCWAGKTFDALAEGIAYVLKRTTSIREIRNLMNVDEGKPDHMVVVLNALRENHSVTSITMYAESVTAVIAATLSDLLAVNCCLKEVNICENDDISSETAKIIVRGLRKNYTVTTLKGAWDLNDSVPELTEIQLLLERNAVVTSTGKRATGHRRVFCVDARSYTSKETVSEGRHFR